MSSRPVKMYYDSLTSEAVRENVVLKKRTQRFTVDEKYRYLGNERNPLYRILSFIVYRVIMTPVAWAYCRFYLGMRFSDHRTEKPASGKGCFLYRNHALTVGDAFEPSVEMAGKNVSVVVDPANMSLKGTRSFLKMCGALPVPSGLRTLNKFTDAVKYRISLGYCVTIYPEAHVWPYCNFIRPFSPGSFSLPVRTGAPVYVSTTVFRSGRRPRVTTVLDGPLYPDPTLSMKEAEKTLSERVHEIMDNRASGSCDTSNYVKYVRKELKE